MPQISYSEYEQETGSPPEDALTGLCSHGFFHCALEFQLSRCEEEDRTLALALIDVDHFSDYNKRHGYIKGDGVLKKLAAIFQEHLSDEYLIARYIGDQFAVMMPATTPETAAGQIEKIRNAIQSTFNGELQISAGIAAFPGDAVTKDALFLRGKEALSHAKVNGLDKVFPYKKIDPISNGRRPKVLLVDDEESNVKLLDAMLRPLRYEVYKAFNGKQALKIVEQIPVDLVLLDIMMPGMDGYEVCRRLKSNEATRMLPVVMVTALDEMEAKLKGIEVGADDFLTKPPNKHELMARTRSLIRVKRMNDNLTSVENVLTSLANVVEAKDAYTEGHVQRVAKLAIDLGSMLGLPEHELEALKLGGILHDIGKIAIPMDILNKPGPLSSEEWQVMMTHANVGYNVCLPLKKTLGSALEIIKGHHEKLDGSGYPDGLIGDEISIAARIMSVVDIYDALISDRPYRAAMTHEEAMATLQKKVDMGLLDSTIVSMLSTLVAGQPFAGD